LIARLVILDCAHRKPRAIENHPITNQSSITNRQSPIVLLAIVRWVAFAALAWVAVISAYRPRHRRTRRKQHEEILICVRPTGSPRDARVRRIQWTPRGGFVENVF
jgi:hypothetical protein